MAAKRPPKLGIGAQRIVEKSEYARFARGHPGNRDSVSRGRLGRLRDLSDILRMVEIDSGCDGALVGYAALIPELMVELLEKAKAHDYDATKEVYDRMMPITRAVYHRESHMESTMAMKLGLVERGLLKNAVVRSPLMPLEANASSGIREALQVAGVL
jgi:dihydrodipicolinate synthase/N-acetylneuraminate lyase